MTQPIHYWVGETQRCREIPDSDCEVIDGVRWGEPWQLFTPAYWLSQFWMGGLDSAIRSPYQARGSLAEELAFCMLGGYGITAELATAAFEACRSAGLISTFEASITQWEAELSKPLLLKGRPTRYRYPRQKARFLANAMSFLSATPLDGCCGRELRDELLKINGVGPKTAGWVARNYLDADDVAILDIHLIRAGILCDLFEPAQKVERDYFEMEARYIEFCHALKVRPAVLDCLIWDQMRTYGKVALGALSHKLGEAGSPMAPKAAQQQLELSWAM